MGLTSTSFLIAALVCAAGLASAQQDAQPAQPTAPQPPAEPYVIEGGGLSIQPLYWFTSARPLLRKGTQSTVEQSADLDYPGKTKGAVGFLFSVPAGKQNTVRFSYFRAKSKGETTAQTPLALFSVGYDAGDLLTTDYSIQNVKVSWDYLTYTFSNNLRLKTLWEAQLTSISTTIDAPLKDVLVDDSGNIITNVAAGNKWLVYPTFGLALEHAPSKHFRWELKGSGFGIPKRATLWDVEASAVLRLGSVDLLAGPRVFSVRTSPNDEAYFRQRLSGIYAGVRWYIEP